MVSNIEKPLKVNATLATLLSELGEECETVLFLLSQLRLSKLTDDQKGDILAELTGSITHLYVHTENLPDLIGDEILALPDGNDQTPLISMVKKSRRITKTSNFEQSNGNIFADLGDPETGQTLVRAQLLSRIIEIISERNLTEDQTATILQLSKQETTALINGKLSQFSLEKLFQILNSLDKDIEIILKPKIDTKTAETRVLVV